MINFRSKMTELPETPSYPTSPNLSILIAKNANPDLIHDNRSVVSILSDPVAMSHRLDVAADEIAELVSSHTYKFHVDDANATLVQFRPVTATHR